MALSGVEQDHVRPDTLPKATGLTLNTPDQASDEWDWSYSLLHRGRCKAFWHTVRGGCGSLTPGLDVKLQNYR